MNSFTEVLGLEPDVLIVDVDTHLTEPADLWSSRAPSKYADRLPRVEESNGRLAWMFDGVEMGIAGGSSAIDRDGEKHLGMSFMGLGYEGIHQGAWRVEPRLEYMDEHGVWAHIVYPNTVGFGGQRFVDNPDEDLRLLAVEIFNDASAELQEESGQRMFPMSITPMWDVDVAVREIRRSHGLGLRGVNMGTGPHTFGLPDLGEAYWNPLWEVCAELAMPVNFHIGASSDTMSWFGMTPWPSQDLDTKLAIGSAMMYLSNAGVMANLIFGGVLERHPEVQFVSVESGIGWIPFFLESLDYQLKQSIPGSTLSLTPTEYFQRQMSACFWFEEAGVAGAVAALGEDRVLFETDFPHPTCLYPDGLTQAAVAVNSLPASARRKVMGDNARRLYRLP
jgi:uncharacterized protein